ncbi:cysteine--tRNA ligase [Candidatus Woesearchaeota archaeon]|nr:cysteine--tRNA ligase [Candidatus Woesearchaeota archaeon]
MLKIYNTLTKKVAPFKTLKEKQVSMYSCGPTVYDFAHIGNFRAYIAADILKRHLLYSGFKVKHVMNITDVDDKTIKGAKKNGVSLKEFTAKFTQAFFEDLQRLSIVPADIFPRATEHIPEMVAIIEKLKKDKLAYQGEDGSWYFDISGFRGYGKLSGLDLESLEATERVKKDSYAKEQAQDFALWKAFDPSDGDVFWETSLGKGRPGWHIECSAMSTKYLGDSFDVHTGGVDLIFPHHENEIAQTVGATHHPFVNYWVHNEHLLVDGKKMSKSLGNFFTLRDLLSKGHKPHAIRYLLLSVHYRQQLNFTVSSLEAAAQAVDKINNFVFLLRKKSVGSSHPEVKRILQKAEKEFSGHMDNDLNISEALSVIFELMNNINKLDIGKGDAGAVLDFFGRVDQVLGILEQPDQAVDSKVKGLIQKRDNARASKDWKKADEIRELLRNEGIELMDTEQGTIWKKT